MTPSVDIILFNAKILAGEGHPTALAVADGKIVMTGDDRDIRRLMAPHTTILDCGGRTVIPGIAGRSLPRAGLRNTTGLRVDCRPAATSDIEAVVDALRGASASRDGWIRGYGYDDLSRRPGPAPDSSRSGPRVHHATLYVWIIVRVTRASSTAARWQSWASTAGRRTRPEV